MVDVRSTPFSNYLHRKRICHISLLLSVLLLSAAAIAEEEIIVWDRTYDQASMLDVLQLAFEKTDDSTPYRLVRSVEMEQGRVMRELHKSRRVDIAAFAPTPEREQKAIAVRIPVSKGLLGFRVCLIRAGEEDTFKDVRSIDDWNNAGYRLGQGTHWPDTPILESNGLTVVKSVRYKPLFHMLEKKRFDCFPRSVNEVRSELERPENNKLTLEKYLMFQYRLPTFFFVNKNKPELAKRIERGLNIAIKDGSFDRLFNQHYRETLNKINMKQRKIIKLNNPYLSNETQSIVRKSELWLNPLE